MKTVIEMALNSGDDEWKILVRQVMKHFPDEFERFAELVRADEREALVESIDWTASMRQGALVTWGDAEELGDRVVAAIRARGSNT